MWKARVQRKLYEKKRKQMIEDARRSIEEKKREREFNV